MRKSGGVQQDAGDREGWRRRTVKTGQPPLAEKICQDKKWMMMRFLNDLLIQKKCY